MKHVNFKLKIRTLATLLLMFAFSTVLQAQQISVTGVIKDASTGCHQLF